MLDAPTRISLRSIRATISRFSSARLVLRLELLDEYGKARGEWSRQRVVLGLERLPERREPSASIAGKHQLARGKPLGPRPANGMARRGAGGRSKWRLRSRRPHLIRDRGAELQRRCDRVAADPLVDPVGRANRGSEVALERRPGGLAYGLFAGPFPCRHERAPLQGRPNYP